MSDPFRPDRQRSWLDKRRDKIVDEIQANRRGEYRVPTWLLVLGLLASILVIVAALIYG
jgi:hypothetical protein